MLPCEHDQGTIFGQFALAPANRLFVKLGDSEIPVYRFQISQSVALKTECHLTAGI
jgi:hypothetical protein